MDDFLESGRRIEADRGVVAAGLGLFAIVLALAWTAWAIKADVTLLEVAATARIERGGATYTIQPGADGRVVATSLQIGRAVTAGEVLVELDAERDRQLLRAEEARAQGLAAELAKLRAQATAQQKAAAEQRVATELAAGEVTSRLGEAAADADYAATDLARMSRLHARGLIPDRDLEGARTAAVRLRSRVTGLEVSSRRLVQDQVTRDREHEVDHAALGARIATLEGDVRSAAASMERLRIELERRAVRAPADGVIGEAAMLRPGAFVSAGQTLASIVPRGGHLIVAQLPAGRALGRVRAGQPARLRLDAYPWSEFGTVAATVTSVAAEIREGGIRVELQPVPGSDFRGTLAHGMPGTVEIAVEQVSPLSLALRTAGQTLSGRR